MGLLKKLCLPNATIFFLSQVGLVIGDHFHPLFVCMHIEYSTIVSMP